MDITNFEFFQEPEIYETVNGKLILMPRPDLDHIELTGNLYRILLKYDFGRCAIFIEPNLYFGAQHLIPDFAIVCDPKIVAPNGLYGPPSIVAEILSPSSYRHDKFVKSKIYAENGIKEYWLIYPREKEIEIYIRTEDSGYDLKAAASFKEGGSVTSETFPFVVVDTLDLFRESPLFKK